MKANVWRVGDMLWESEPIRDTRWLPRLWAWLNLQEPPVVEGWRLVTLTDLRTGFAITFEERSAR